MSFHSPTFSNEERKTTMTTTTPKGLADVLCDCVSRERYECYSVNDSKVITTKIAAAAE